MKQVVLIGDSIRQGYLPFVAKLLEGKADVWGAEMNGGHSVNVLLHLHEWVCDRPVDLLHLNAGLHDLKCIPYGSREMLIPPSQYAANVERLCRLARNWRVGRIIWAATTPVIDDHANTTHAQSHDFSRYNEHVIELNAIAKRVTADLGVAFNDLYAVVDQAGSATVQCGDGVHYKPEGYELLAHAVVKAIGL